MENNELGRIYGSRISKSGKYLNLIIVATIEGKEVKITCPVKLERGNDESKPFAALESCNGKGKIYNLPVFEDKAKPKEAKTGGDTIEAPLFVEGDPNEGLPF